MNEHTRNSFIQSHFNEMLENMGTIQFWNDTYRNLSLDSYHLTHWFLALYQNEQKHNRCLINRLIFQSPCRNTLIYIFQGGNSTHKSYENNRILLWIGIQFTFQQKDIVRLYKFLKVFSCLIMNESTNTLINHDCLIKCITKFWKNLNSAKYSHPLPHNQLSFT